MMVALPRVGVYSREIFQEVAVIIYKNFLNFVLLWNMNFSEGN